MDDRDYRSWAANNNITQTLSNQLSCGAKISHMTVQNQCWSHSLSFPRSHSPTEATSHRRPLGYMLYFILFPILLKVGHSQPLPSLLWGMWAPNVNAPTSPAIVAQNAFMGHQLARYHITSPFQWGPLRRNLNPHINVLGGFRKNCDPRKQHPTTIRNMLPRYKARSIGCAGGLVSAARAQFGLRGQSDYIGERH